MANWDFVNFLRKLDEGVCNFQAALLIDHALYMIESAVTAYVLYENSAESSEILIKKACRISIKCPFKILKANVSRRIKDLQMLSWKAPFIIQR